ncbi:hypothetical protein CDAR_212191 [Caerostris darwini]|uniref:Uncharacterized protein n=1 Tax=Caerostris darwini TaxID=1538125 RepID=A0AAV4NRX4_9ARAC|nr:hypothetical protein CDAR_212191 [Caerostris darwini]
MAHSEWGGRRKGIRRNRDDLAMARKLYLCKGVGKTAKLIVNNILLIQHEPSINCTIIRILLINHPYLNQLPPSNSPQPDNPVKSRCPTFGHHKEILVRIKSDSTPPHKNCSKTNVLPHRYHSPPAIPILRERWVSGGRGVGGRALITGLERLGNVFQR